MSWKGSKVAVLYGGESDEREVSLATGKAIFEALEGLGHTVSLIDATAEGLRAFAADPPDVVFIALHGGAGENGTVQGLCEALGVPYTGSGVCGSALAMNKVVAKQIWAQSGLPTAAWQGLSRADVRDMLEATELDVPIPAVIKPAFGGSSVGVTLVRTADQFLPALSQALRQPGPVLLESLITGRELTVGLMDGQVMGIMEVIPSEGFYDYKAKYQSDQTRYRPAALPSATHELVAGVARQANELLGARGVTRVDIILDDDTVPWLLELNTVPGMTQTSLVPKIAAAAGLSFPELVERILDGARLDSETWYE